MSGSDPDGDTLGLVATGLPAFATFTDNNDGTGTLSFSPIAGDKGNYPVTITATDPGGLSDEKNMTVSVSKGKGTVLARINTGGPAYVIDSTDWAADRYADAGETDIETVPIEGTGNDRLYQTDRYGKTFSYSIPTGIMDSVTVRLHFAEIYHGIKNSLGVGARIFNVDIENGQGQLTGYDIIESAGAPATAIIETFSGIEVADGDLTIAFTTIQDNAKISGIEVVTSGTVNLSPVLAHIGNLDLTEGDSLGVGITASDPNGDTLRLAATGLPPFMAFTDNGDGTGLLSLSPGAGEGCRYKFALTATDANGLADEDSITVFVSTGRETVLARINGGGEAYIFNGEDWGADQICGHRQGEHGVRGHKRDGKRPVLQNRARSPMTFR